MIESNKKITEIHQKDGKKIGDYFEKADHSKVDSVKSTSQETYERVQQFIEKTENDLKEDPLITEKDEGYNLYLQWNQTKQEIIIMERSKIWKQRLRCSLYTILLIILLLVITILLVKYLYLDHSDKQIEMNKAESADKQIFEETI